MWRVALTLRGPHSTHLHASVAYGGARPSKRTRARLHPGTHTRAHARAHARSHEHQVRAFPCPSLKVCGTHTRARAHTHTHTQRARLPCLSLLCLSSLLDLPNTTEIESAYLRSHRHSEAQSPSHPPLQHHSFLGYPIPSPATRRGARPPVPDRPISAVPDRPQVSESPSRPFPVLMPALTGCCLGPDARRRSPRLCSPAPRWRCSTSAATPWAPPGPPRSTARAPPPRPARGRARSSCPPPDPHRAWWRRWLA